MQRLSLLSLVLAVFLGGALGCGNDSSKQEGKGSFKARQESAPSAKEKKQGGGGIMKPGD